MNNFNCREVPQELQGGNSHLEAEPSNEIPFFYWRVIDQIDQSSISEITNQPKVQKQSYEDNILIQSDQIIQGWSQLNQNSQKRFIFENQTDNDNMMGIGVQLKSNNKECMATRQCENKMKYNSNKEVRQLHEQADSKVFFQSLIKINMDHQHQNPHPPTHPFLESQININLQHKDPFQTQNHSHCLKSILEFNQPSSSFMDDDAHQNFSQPNTNQPANSQHHTAFLKESLTSSENNKREVKHNNHGEKLNFKNRKSEYRMINSLVVESAAEESDMEVISQTDNSHIRKMQENNHHHSDSIEPNEEIEESIIIKRVEGPPNFNQTKPMPAQPTPHKYIQVNQPHLTHQIEVPSPENLKLTNAVFEKKQEELTKEYKKQNLIEKPIKPGQHIKSHEKQTEELESMRSNEIISKINNIEKIMVSLKSSKEDTEAKIDERNCKIKTEYRIYQNQYKSHQIKRISPIKSIHNMKIENEINKLKEKIRIIENRYNYVDDRQKHKTKLYERFKSYSRQKEYELKDEPKISQFLDVNKVQKLNSYIKHQINTFKYQTHSISKENILKSVFTVLQFIGCKLTKISKSKINLYKSADLIYCQFPNKINQNVIWHFAGKFYIGGTQLNDKNIPIKNGIGFEYDPYRFVYEGGFVLGKRCGKGRMIFWNEYDYCGGWKQNEMEGFGQLKVWKGDQYSGGFHKGEKEGYGKQSFSNQDSYQGEYHHGFFHGKGVYQWKNKSTYKGHFHKGLMHGSAVWTSPTGDLYQGKYTNNQKHGLGYYRWKNGKSFKGEFHSGKPYLSHQNNILEEESSLANLSSSLNLSEQSLSIRFS